MRHCRAVLISSLAGMVFGCANGGEITQGGEVREIKTAQELKAKMDAGDVLLIHAFDAENYAKRHIPGAVNVDYEKMTPSMLPADKEKPLVFYCVGGMCPVGGLATQKAADWGHKNVWVYSGGMTDWQAAGMTFATGGE